MWDPEESAELDVNEVVAGGGADGLWITLKPNELCHYTVVRTDAVPTERWYVDVLSSTNAGREDDPPFERYVMDSTELVKSFAVASIYSFKVRIGNADPTPVDVVETDHYWRKNGVSL